LAVYSTPPSCPINASFLLSLRQSQRFVSAIMAPQLNAAQHILIKTLLKERFETKLIATEASCSVRAVQRIRLKRQQSRIINTVSIEKCIWVDLESKDGKSQSLLRPPSCRCRDSSVCCQGFWNEPSLVGRLFAGHPSFQNRVSQLGAEPRGPRFRRSISIRLVSLETLLNITHPSFLFWAPERCGLTFFAETMVSLEQLKPLLELAFYLITFLSFLVFVDSFFWIIGVEDCTVTPTSTTDYPLDRQPIGPWCNIIVLKRSLKASEWSLFVRVQVAVFFCSRRFSSNLTSRRPPPRGRRRSCLSLSNPKPQPSVLSENLTRFALSICQSSRPLAC
jgi:hypothetical protein